MSTPSPRPCAAALFDLDGTLVDNMRFHVQAWSAFARAHGLEVSGERFEREFAGKRNEEILPVLLGHTPPPEELTRLAEQKEAHYRALFAPHLQPLAGARALLTRLKAAGRGLAVASAAPRVNRDFVLVTRESGNVRMTRSCLESNSTEDGVCAACNASEERDISSRARFSELSTT